ncbi:TetR/AcrR family transcriptional regulator [Saccharomonospora iraqiensis]|uniref:TetR/AcrR family transcriptional regulator n=1 Tax=Saccharomonospora iraqiensis TaxID=52698 RepID=UPI00022E0388|nr:TetR/AcrR family transcriptional regulator [Saccharomonospora iraqiensis]
MPRIQAATVAEHHEHQRRALIAAARGILAETGEVPTMGEVGRRAGLARSSVYQYFASAEELLAAVVADSFPDWARHVLDRVAAASSPGARVWAYIEANVELFTGPQQAVANALMRTVDPQVLHTPMKEFHAQLQVPLREALTALGEPEPEAMAEHLGSLVVQVARDVGPCTPAAPDTDPGTPAATDAGRRALARLRRLLGGYLHLPPTTEAHPTP